ncbi:Pericentrin [Galemys pyrenaicus]|uniref:Pericentrin n=1 Tax=Galemys pyrenaicus TaxID=202257 RepID=A0A8J6AG44_GALPY|nr:Pericentrin [Galemys pyrenaicus]
MEKLYLHYLRAESFRKALIYQKKYLLLLIGGFQDSEQETLSMIAHLGVFPSKADGPARPFTRFRTAVRVVVAISRWAICPTCPVPWHLGGGKTPHCPETLRWGEPCSWGGGFVGSPVGR